jgi:hypothetical protein
MNCTYFPSKINSNLPQGKARANKVRNEGLHDDDESVEGEAAGSELKILSMKRENTGVNA